MGRAVNSTLLLNMFVLYKTRDLKPSLVPNNSEFFDRLLVTSPLAPILVMELLNNFWFSHRTIKVVDTTCISGLYWKSERETSDPATFWSVRIRLIP